MEKLSSDATSHSKPTGSIAHNINPSLDNGGEPSHSNRSRCGSQDEPQDTRIQGVVKGEAVVEGQSSLSAHSSFAMTFLHNFVGANTTEDQNAEIGGLLETLRHIVEVSHDQQVSSKPLLPLARKTLGRCGDSNMPPLEKMVFVLQKARSTLQCSWGSCLHLDFYSSMAVPVMLIMI